VGSAGTVFIPVEAAGSATFAIETTAGASTTEGAAVTAEAASNVLGVTTTFAPGLDRLDLDEDEHQGCHEADESGALDHFTASVHTSRGYERFLIYRY
jgi:hypothetical protein